MTIAIYFGIPVVAFGFVLMFWHLRQWEHQRQTVREERERAFYGRQFKRRATIGSLIAIVGSVIISLRWISDPVMFSVSVFLLLALLALIVCIALADLFYGVLHTQHGADAQKARKALVHEYLRMRERSGTQSAETGSSQTEESTDTNRGS